MAAVTRDEFMARTRRSVGQEILYWLGFGGSEGAPPTAPLPGTPINAFEAYQRKKTESPQVAAAYQSAMQQLKLRWEDLPTSACDCSGFVSWAMGASRKQPQLLQGWMNTDAIHHDATGPQTQFRTVAQAAVGSLLVYPKGGGHDVGHVAVVSALDAQGRPLRMIHCAPENFALPPEPGGRRSAIRETDCAVFTANPATRVVEYRLFAA